MAHYEQMELDVRLEADRELDENISVAMSFAHNQLAAEKEDDIVRNRYEGYGILADASTALNAAEKQVSDGMKNLLRALSVSDDVVINSIASLDNSLVELVTAAVKMSAQARRINENLYDSMKAYKSPIEAYAESLADGFEEAESEETEVNEDGEE